MLISPAYPYVRAINSIAAYSISPNLVALRTFLRETNELHFHIFSRHLASKALSLLTILILSVSVPGK